MYSSGGIAGGLHMLNIIGYGQVGGKPYFVMLNGWSPRNGADNLFYWEMTGGLDGVTEEFYLGGSIFARTAQAYWAVPGASVVTPLGQEEKKGGNPDGEDR